MIQLSESALALVVHVEPSWVGSTEHQCLSLFGMRCEVQEIPAVNTIHIGSVEYSRAVNNYRACDPYPEWLPMCRKIHRVIPPKYAAFYKPADVPKRFESRVMSKPPDTPWVASDIVHFVEEYRAYVVAGEVLCVRCYSDFENTQKATFPWPVPRNITAAIDFGVTDTGEVMPVEVNDPYAIGWYGTLSEYKLYAYFIINGFLYMQASIHKT